MTAKASAIAILAVASVPVGLTLLVILAYLGWLP